MIGGEVDGSIEPAFLGKDCSFSHFENNAEAFERDELSFSNPKKEGTKSNVLTITCIRKFKTGNPKKNWSNNLKIEFMGPVQSGVIFKVRKPTRELRHDPNNLSELKGIKIM